MNTSSDNEVSLNNQYDCKDIFRTQYLEQYILSILIDKSITHKHHKEGHKETNTLYYMIGTW